MWMLLIDLLLAAGEVLVHRRKDRRDRRRRSREEGDRPEESGSVLEGLGQ